MKRLHHNTPERTNEERKSYRERIDVLRSRVEMLVGRDKVLMTMYLDNGNSFRQIARLTGEDEVTIGRRIKKIMRRLSEGAYIKCLRKREKFSPLELEIARDHFLSGLAMRNIAAKRKCSYYRVCSTVNRIKKWAADK